MEIMIKPIVTEKATKLSEKLNRYTFRVSPEANKYQIKDAVEEIFGVQVEKVNTVNVRGKLKRQGRTQGYTAKYKKAIVLFCRMQILREFQFKTDKRRAVPF